MVSQEHMLQVPCSPEQALDGANPPIPRRNAAAREGANELEIKVINLWPNRLIGDKQPGAGAPCAWTTFDRAYNANSPLLPSGLFGPVRLMASTG